MNDLITIGAYSVALNPILPWPALIALGAIYGGLIVFALARHARGTFWRVVAGLLITFALLDPSLVEEQRNYQKDVAVVLVDRSPSQNLGNRAQETNDALAEVRRQLALLPDLDVRVIEGGGGPDSAEKGTELMGVLQRGLADVFLRFGRGGDQLIGKNMDGGGLVRVHAGKLADRCWGRDEHLQLFIPLGLDGGRWGEHHRRFTQLPNQFQPDDGLPCTGRRDEMVFLVFLPANHLLQNHALVLTERVAESQPVIQRCQLRLLRCRELRIL